MFRHRDDVSAVCWETEERSSHVYHMFRHRDDLSAVCWETEECSLCEWMCVSCAMPAATYLITLTKVPLGAWSRFALYIIMKLLLYCRIWYTQRCEVFSLPTCTCVYVILYCYLSLHVECLWLVLNVTSQAKLSPPPTASPLLDRHSHAHRLSSLCIFMYFLLSTCMRVVCVYLTVTVLAALCICCVCIENKGHLQYFQDVYSYSWPPLPSLLLGELLIDERESKSLS